MAMEEDFRAVLQAASAVTGLTASRIDWGSNAQGSTGPRVVLNVISANNGHTMEGPDALSESRVQVDCYAETYSAAKALSRAVLAALDGHRGGQMQGIFHAGSRDGQDGGTSEAERVFRVSMDFMTNWSA